MPPCALPVPMGLRARVRVNVRPVSEVVSASVVVLVLLAVVSAPSSSAFATWSSYGRGEYLRLDCY